MTGAAKNHESTEKLEQREEDELERYALTSRKRRNLVERFREHADATRLEYRTEYHRDRDRILWCLSFKRLQHKTQVFPHYMQDHYRRRLTHTMEVAQIATTVARALGLNEVATEAIALGHDLGHTPFGHSGEVALNEVLLASKDRPGAEKTPIPVFCFDHCVHAIEVVSRIEREYWDKEEEAGHHGLNLTFDVRDGILKHMYDREPDAERPLSTIQEVVRFPAYSDFENNKGSLEAQCVYFADKVAYLLGDIEDGLRSGILDRGKLEKDPFIALLWDLYEKRRQPEQIAMKPFPPFRRKVLAVLILECIEYAQSGLSSVTSLAEVFSTLKRFVYVPEHVAAKWTAFYDEWMLKFLFVNHNVTASSAKAQRIVSDLFKEYLDDLNLIDRDYRKHAEAAYSRLIPDPEQLKYVIVRNYVAGMSDAFATNQHARLFMSTEHVRFT